VSLQTATRKKRTPHNFNAARVDRIIAFIEQLTVPSGHGAGTPFTIRPWQRRFIEDVYGPVNISAKQRWRLVRRAVLSIARKNGKTALIAALVLVHLCGPEAITNGEIYSAANDREQAGQVFKFVKQMIDLDTDLQELVYTRPSTKTAVCRHNGSFYRAISAEAGTKHGLNPSVVIFDELAQAKNRELFDVLDTSMGAREEPLFITISTQSADPNHILSKLIDDGLSGADETTVCHLYAANDDAELLDEAAWADANPALGDFRNIDDVRVLANRASRMPSFEASFRNLYMNQRVALEATLINRADWKACEALVELRPRQGIYLGLDLSGTTDLTALVASSDDEEYDAIKAWFWKPADKIKDHEVRDRAPYSLWVKEGWITTTPGRSIDYASAAKLIGQLHKDYDIKGLAFDRWRINDFLRALDAEGIAAKVDERVDPSKEPWDPTYLRLVPWGQGYRDMAPAVDALETAVLEAKLRHGSNPVLTWNVANAIVTTDPAGNRKLDKDKARFRIDGAVALSMAKGLKSRDRSKKAGPSVYETRGIRVI
jgi:phage terminase large subunit-like protein